MHGPRTLTPGVSAAPNLTPLLDVVLQLLMFFIICTNFKMEEASTDIMLPAAQSARPVDKSDVDVLFVNLTGEGKVLVLGREPMSLLEAKYWLRQQYEDAERNARDGKVNTAIILRAARDADYEKVYQLLRICKEQGFKRFNVRALTISGEPT
ncbi:MAG TPA: biopolymer transporter ExbD [Gemmataceae bacterium]|nr:biopolymer transporter ExbD [Gemmataceae bacterium]